MLGARTRVSLGDHVRPQQHHRANFALRHRVADAGRMTANEISLKVREALRRDRHIRQLAESCRHAVDRRAVGEQAIDRTTRRSGSLVRGPRYRYRGKVAGDGDDVLDAKGIAVNDDLVRHARECQRRSPRIQDW